MLKMESNVYNIDSILKSKYILCRLLIKFNCNEVLGKENIGICFVFHFSCYFHFTRSLLFVKLVAAVRLKRTEEISNMIHTYMSIDSGINALDIQNFRTSFFVANILKEHFCI